MRHLESIIELHDPSSCSALDEVTSVPRGTMTHPVYGVLGSERLNAGLWLSVIVSACEGVVLARNSSQFLALRSSCYLQ